MKKYLVLLIIVFVLNICSIILFPLFTIKTYKYIPEDEKVLYARCDKISDFYWCKFTIDDFENGSVGSIPTTPFGKEKSKEE